MDKSTAKWTSADIYDTSVQFPFSTKTNTTNWVCAIGQADVRTTEALVRVSIKLSGSFVVEESPR
jgi:hypothetical protein